MACKSGLPSKFTWDGARLHLMNMHHIYPFTAYATVEFCNLYLYDGVIKHYTGKKPLVERQGCFDHQLRSNKPSTSTTRSLSVLASDA